MPNGFLTETHVAKVQLAL
jgi:hypothetical protein